MSAARIREAAKVLRDAAESATPGPWVVDYAEDVVSTATEQHPWIAHPYKHSETEANAAYIALMAPPVALALADWLDDIEVLWSSAESMHDADGDPLTFGESIDSHALALANTILGDRA